MKQKMPQSQTYPRHREDETQTQQPRGAAGTQLKLKQPTYKNLS